MTTKKRSPKTRTASKDVVSTSCLLRAAPATLTTVTFVPEVTILWSPVVEPGTTTVPSDGFFVVLATDSFAPDNEVGGAIVVVGTGVVVVVVEANMAVVVVTVVDVISVSVVVDGEAVAVVVVVVVDVDVNVAVVFAVVRVTDGGNILSFGVCLVVVVVVVVGTGVVLLTVELFVMDPLEYGSFEGITVE